MSTPARYRGARAENEASKPSNDVAGDATKKAEKSASGGWSISLVDVLRIAVAILGVVIATSYLSTNGESMTWYYNPWWTRAREWKALFVCLFFFLFFSPYLLTLITTTTYRPVI